MNKHPNVWIVLGIIILLALIVSGGLWWYWNRPAIPTQTEKKADDTEPADGGEVSTDITFTEEQFTFAAPEGWTAGEENINPNFSVHNFSNTSTGEYFNIEVNRPRGFCGEDFVWGLRPNTEGNGYTIFEEGEQMTGTSEFCEIEPLGDGAFRGIAFETSDPQQNLGGDIYTFSFGDENNEADANAQVFRDMILSFRTI